jgi:hypothetical protein
VLWELMPLGLQREVRLVGRRCSDQADALSWGVKGTESCSSGFSPCCDTSSGVMTLLSELGLAVFCHLMVATVSVFGQ